MLGSYPLSPVLWSLAFLVAFALPMPTMQTASAMLSSAEFGPVARSTLPALRRAATPAEGPTKLLQEHTGGHNREGN